MKLGIVSDIHEDSVRLSTALNLLDRMGCHEVACLGDICGFVIPSFGYLDERDASRCLQLVRNNCKYIVAGNHDLSAAQRIPESAAGFIYPKNWYKMDYQERKILAGEEIWINEETELPSLLSAEEAAFLSSIPEYAIIMEKDVNIMLSHYLYPDLCGCSIRYYKEFGPVEVHLDYMESYHCQIGFSGHKHVEGFYKANQYGLQHQGFGNYKLEREQQWIVGPCVANGKYENGCMIFDTETFSLEVISLQTPPRVMHTINIINGQNAV